MYYLVKMFPHTLRLSWKEGTFSKLFASMPVDHLGHLRVHRPWVHLLYHHPCAFSLKCQGLQKETLTTCYYFHLTLVLNCCSKVAIVPQWRNACSAWLQCTQLGRARAYNFLWVKCDLVESMTYQLPIDATLMIAPFFLAIIAGKSWGKLCSCQIYLQ